MAASDDSTPDATTVSLTVLPGPSGAPDARRRGRMSRRRAWILGVVQMLILVHIGLWLYARSSGWLGGRTISPVEPSESMEFVKYGIVNAGLIFFVLALLSTALLGRWVCGWGCHVILLQDLCGWILGKMNIRPKPFRSRLLIYAPFVLALYMFVWPAVYRWGVAPLMTAFGVGSDRPLPAWRLQTEVVTADFWATFPGLFVAVPFLFVCGFAAVYFLGMKGYCTYGCPYGGFFAPLDQYAPGRIRVSDACDETGHCTAACTSNVRVHEEVREYGMVVDPGCMKCMDCVAACPNEALSFGFGKPAAAKDPPKNAAPKKKFDLTLREEVAIAAVFALVFLSVRSVYGLIPMLMASGVAGIVAFGAWKTWRLVRDENVAFHRYRLKYKGAWRGPGVIFAAVTVLALVASAHSGVIRLTEWRADRFDRQVTISAGAIFSGQPIQAPDDMRAAAADAITQYERLRPITRGGWALLGSPGADLRRAWMYASRLEFDQAEAVLRASIDTYGANEARLMGLGRVLRGAGRPHEAEDLYRDVTAAHPEWTRLADEFVLWLEGEGRTMDALAAVRRAQEAAPENLLLMRRRSLMEAQYGDVERGIALIRRTIEIDPDNVAAYEALALALVAAERPYEAIVPIERAIEMAPDQPRLRRSYGAILEQLGDIPAAQAQYAIADRIESDGGE